MDDERRQLIRRMFTAITVQAERCAEIGVDGQTNAIDAKAASELANEAITIAQLLVVISEAVHALTADAT